MKIYMNENWPEIVESLQPYFKANSPEDDYQREIENCLKYLGWKKTNGTMRSQLSLPIGNSNAIRPDIVLLMNDNPVLPIEIKRPLNVHKERQENQLMSYMRQLRLNVGLLIGEKIELYYDVPDDGENPVCVFSAEINRADVNGSIICDMLEYKKFNSEELEKFCKEQHNKIMARNNLHQRLAEFLSEDNGVRNVMSLLREKFAAEGFDDNVINEEFANVIINVSFKGQGAVSVTKKNDKVISKDKPKYSIDRINFYVKRRFVLEVIRRYIKEHPNITFEELEKQFPESLHTKSLGVVRTLDYVEMRMKSQPDLRNRYFLKPDEILVLNNGAKVVVTNQWGDLFPKFLNCAKKLYNVVGDNENLPEYKENLKRTIKNPVTKLRITFEDGIVIAEKDSAASFRRFIEEVGVENVKTLNIPGRKDVPLISDSVSPGYEKYQRRLSDGRYLFSNFSTRGIKIKIEQIAQRLSIELKVEILAK